MIRNQNSRSTSRLGILAFISFTAVVAASILAFAATPAGASGFSFIGSVGQFLGLGSAKNEKIRTVSAAKKARIAADEASNDGSGSESLAAMVPQAPLANPVIYAYDFRDDRLISFNAATPGTLITNVALSGLDTANNEALEFIDFRPANGVLYAVANKDGVPRIARVVTINLATGAVSSVGGTIPPITPNLNFSGGDFDSLVDRIREVDTANANRRLNPNDGSVTANDTPLAYAAGDPFFGTVPRVSHVAYSNNTLYGIDNETDHLVRIGSFGGTPISANSGQLFTVGPLGVNVLRRI
jgi:phosphoribosylformylglycinamidine (FGAM) synthase PurS component